MTAIFNKIVIFGLPGSGKSTFARKLAEHLELPIYHLDRHFFVKNWIQRDHQGFLEIHQNFVEQPKWVIDGNPMKSLEMRFQKADVVIYFHYPIKVCFWRILKRAFQKNWRIPDLAEGCRKSASYKLIKYMYQFHVCYTPHINELRQKYPSVPFHILKSDCDAKEFLRVVEKFSPDKKSEA